MMHLSPEIYPDPYNEKQFLEMGRKIDGICSKDFSRNYLIILKAELEGVSGEEVLLTRRLIGSLVEKMKEYSTASACAEVFFNSIFKEFHESFENQPVEHSLRFIEKLTLLSKN